MLYRMHKYFFGYQTEGITLCFKDSEIADVFLNKKEKENTELKFKICPAKLREK